MLKDKRVRMALISVSYIVGLIGIYALLITFINIIRNLMGVSKLSYFNWFIICIWIIIYNVLVSGILIYVKINSNKGNKLERSNVRHRSKLYGEARFQTEEEELKYYGAGKDYHNLLNNDSSGVVIKSFFKKNEIKCLMAKKEHSLIVGSTGSGKTTQIIIPTIFANASSSLKSSMLVYDLKGDIFNKTSLYCKEKGYNVIYLNLKDVTKTKTYNPLSTIYNDYFKYRNSENLAIKIRLETKISSAIDNVVGMIVNYKEEDTWNNGAKSILKGVIYAMLEEFYEKNVAIEYFTILQISNIVSNQNNKLEDWLRSKSMTSESRKYTSILTGKQSDKTKASYLSVVYSGLKNFISSQLKYLTSSSDINLDDVVANPTIIYLIFNDVSEESKIFCSLFMENLRNHLIFTAESEGRETLDRTWYFLLDEFANMPKVGNFNKWLSTDRSRNIFYSIYLQGLTQLDNLYNEAQKDEILSNSTIKVYLKANDTKTIETFIKLFSEYTLQAYSTNSKEGSEGNFSLKEKELVTSSDLIYISEHTGYVICSGKFPIKTVYEPWYEMKELEVGKVEVEDSLFNECPFYTISGKEKKEKAVEEIEDTNFDDEERELTNEELGVTDDGFLIL